MGVVDLVVLLNSIIVSCVRVLKIYGKCCIENVTEDLKLNIV
jgi:hypothetical protein